MGEVVSFRDFAQTRRRRRQEEQMRECVRILELNLQLAFALYEIAPAEERPHRARQIRQLAEVLDYAVRAG